MTEPTIAQKIIKDKEANIQKDKEKMSKAKKPEPQRVEVKTDMTMEGFYNEMIRLNSLGQKGVQHHKEKIPPPKTTDGATKAKGGHRYHEPGSQYDCPWCKPIIKSFEDMQMLQAKQIGMTGIPLDGLFSAIKITRATVLMMKNGGEL